MEIMKTTETNKTLKAEERKFPLPQNILVAKEFFFELNDWKRISKRTEINIKNTCNLENTYSIKAKTNSIKLFFGFCFE